MLRLTVLAAMLCAVSAPAMASDSHLYGSIDFLRAEMRFDEVDGFRIPRQRANGAALSLGYRFHPNLAVELRGAQTRSTTVVSTGEGAASARFGIDYAVGGYLKAIWPASPGRIEPYLLLGVTRAESRTAITGMASVRESETDVSYGVGTHLWANSRAGMKLEYTRYIDTGGIRIEAPHIGFIVRF